MSRRETERMGRHRNNVKVHKDLIERTLDILEESPVPIGIMLKEKSRLRHGKRTIRSAVQADLRRV